LAHAPEAVEATLFWFFPSLASIIMMCEPTVKYSGSLSPTDTKLVKYLLCGICFVGENHECKPSPKKLKLQLGRHIGTQEITA
jgi:hypothetical protein